MIGGGFQHDICSSALNVNTYVEWIKGEHTAPVSFHIDNAILSPVDDSKENYGWFCESSAIIPNLIKNVLSNLEHFKKKFKFIFTHDRRIIQIDRGFFKFNVPPAKPWIQNKKIYKKHKLISMIGSNKTMCPGHNFRQKIIQKYKGRIEHYGRGFGNKELPWAIGKDENIESGKILGLKDYMFSLAMENDNYDDIFCEKITDCFATGTIPIFWGTKNISNYFDKRGIIFLEDLEDIGLLTKELYESKLEFVSKNLDLLSELDTMEDYIFKNYFKGL